MRTGCRTGPLPRCPHVVASVSCARTRHDALLQQIIALARDLAQLIVSRTEDEQYAALLEHVVHVLPQHVGGLVGEIRGRLADGRHTRKIGLRGRMIHRHSMIGVRRGIETALVRGDTQRGGQQARREKGAKRQGTRRWGCPAMAAQWAGAGGLGRSVGAATVRPHRVTVDQAVKQALESSLGEGTLVLCHVSHVYETGCSLYFTVAAKQGADPIAQWLAAKAARLPSP